MKVELMYHSPIYLAVKAARKCTHTEGAKSACEKDDMELLQKIIKMGHTSVIEHIFYTFDIPELSRACLQEIARHRIASPSVQSTRFTLGKPLNKELSMEEAEAMLHMSGDEDIDNLNLSQLLNLRMIMTRKGLKNDVAKYALPEAFKTTMMWTINARSLRNFLQLRTAPRALKEIRELAHAIMRELPVQHDILYHDILTKEEANV